MATSISIDEYSQKAKKITVKYENNAHDFIDEYNWYNLSTSLPEDDDVIQVWRRVSSFIITDGSGKFITPADLVPVSRGVAPVYLLWGYLLPSPGSDRTSLLIQVKVTNYCIDFGFSKDDPSRGFWVYHDSQEGSSQSQTYYKLELPASVYKTFAAFDFFRMEHYLTLCNVLFFSNNFTDDDKKEGVVGYCDKSLEGIYALEKKKNDSGQGGILIDIDVIKENSEFIANLLSPILNKKNSKDFFNSLSSSNSLKRKERDESDSDGVGGKNGKYKKKDGSSSSWYVTVLNANDNCGDAKMQPSMHSMIIYSPDGGVSIDSNSNNNSNSTNRSNIGESNIGSHDMDETMIRSSTSMVTSSSSAKSTKDIIGSGKVNSSKSGSSNSSSSSSINKKVSLKTKKAGVSTSFIMDDDEDDTRQPINIGTTKLDDEQKERISTLGIKNLQGLVDQRTLASLKDAGINSSSDKKLIRVGSKSDNEAGKETVMLKRTKSKNTVWWPDRVEKNGKYGELSVEYEPE